MASYANFLGRKVTVSYRVSDILLPASGTFVGDSGRSIFLEQHLEQRGRINYFRWEIPYQNIYRIAETPEPEEAAPPAPPEPSHPISEAPPGSSDECSPAGPSIRAAGAAAGASAGTSPLFPQQPHHKLSS